MKVLLHWFKKHGHFLGIVIFAYIIFKIDIKKLLDILRASDGYYNALSVLLSFSIIPIMACISFTKGALLGQVTPGRLGEFLRAKYLISDANATMGKAFFSVVIDRIYDIIILLVLSCMSVVILTKTYAIDIPSSVIISFSATLAVCLALFMNERFVRRAISPAFNFLIPEKHQENAHLHFTEFYSGLKTMRKSTHAYNLFLSTVIWIFKFLMLFFISKALGLNISFWLILAIGSINVIASLLPISISGFGTREAIFIFFLSLHKINSEFAVALSFMFLVFSTLSVAVSGGVIFIHSAFIKLYRPRS